MREKKAKLYPQICPECEKLLCWSMIDTETYCPNCRKWYRQEGKAVKKGGE
jgi:hypothetical protein